MFFGSFAWSFVFVSLPFHIQRVSTLEPPATLRWTGWIVGITSLVTVMTAPIWGRYAARGNPKACYVPVEGLGGLILIACAALVHRAGPQPPRAEQVTTTGLPVRPG